MYHISRVWYLTLDCLTCEHIPCIACTTVGADLLSLESLHFVFWFSSIPKFTSKQLKKKKHVFYAPNFEGMKIKMPKKTFESLFENAYQTLRWRYYTKICYAGTSRRGKGDVN